MTNHTYTPTFSCTGTAKLKLFNPLRITLIFASDMYWETRADISQFIQEGNAPLSPPPETHYTGEPAFEGFRDLKWWVTVGPDGRILDKGCNVWPHIIYQDFKIEPVGWSEAG